MFNKLPNHMLVLFEAESMFASEKNFATNVAIGQIWHVPTRARADPLAGK